MSLVDTPLTTLADAEHLLRGVSEASDDDVTICTHMLRVGRPHYAISISRGDAAPVDVGAMLGPVAAQWPTWHGIGQSPLADNHASNPPPSAVVREITSADGGRAVVFFGQNSVRGSVTVQALLELTAIEQVDVLGHSSIDGADTVHTRDFLRPLWRAGALVLAVLPAGDHAFAPFEVPNPTPCCAEHQ